MADDNKIKELQHKAHELHNSLESQMYLTDIDEIIRELDETWEARYFEHDPHAGLPPPMSEFIQDELTAEIQQSREEKINIIKTKIQKISNELENLEKKEKNISAKPKTNPLISGDTMELATTIVTKIKKSDSTDSTESESDKSIATKSDSGKLTATKTVIDISSSTEESKKSDASMTEEEESKSKDNLRHIIADNVDNVPFDKLMSPTDMVNLEFDVTGKVTSPQVSPKSETDVEVPRSTKTFGEEETKEEIKDPTFILATKLKTFYKDIYDQNKKISEKINLAYDKCEKEIKDFEKHIENISFDNNDDYSFFLLLSKKFKEKLKKTNKIKMFEALSILYFYVFIKKYDDENSIKKNVEKNIYKYFSTIDSLTTSNVINHVVHFLHGILVKHMLNSTIILKNSFIEKKKEAVRRGSELTDKIKILKNEKEIKTVLKFVCVHQTIRFFELHLLLSDCDNVNIIIAGNGGLLDTKGKLQPHETHGLGAKIAKDTWDRIYPSSYEKIKNHLDILIITLINNFPLNVFIGNVGKNHEDSADGKFYVDKPRAPSATYIHVWGANSGNFNNTDSEKIGGSGQAAAMNDQTIGVFGVCTMPLENTKHMLDIMAPYNYLEKYSDEHLEVCGKRSKKYTISYDIKDDDTLPDVAMSIGATSPIATSPIELPENVIIYYYDYQNDINIFLENIKVLVLYDDFTVNIKNEDYISGKYSKYRSDGSERVKLTVDKNRNDDGINAVVLGIPFDINTKEGVELVVKYIVDWVAKEEIKYIVINCTESGYIAPIKPSLYISGNIQPSINLYSDYFKQYKINYNSIILQNINDLQRELQEFNQYYKQAEENKLIEDFFLDAEALYWYLYRYIQADDSGVIKINKIEWKFPHMYNVQFTKQFNYNYPINFTVTYNTSKTLNVEIYITEICKRTKDHIERLRWNTIEELNNYFEDFFNLYLLNKHITSLFSTSDKIPVIFSNIFDFINYCNYAKLYFYLIYNETRKNIKIFTILIHIINEKLEVLDKMIHTPYTDGVEFEIILQSRKYNYPLFSNNTTMVDLIKSINDKILLNTHSIDKPLNFSTNIEIILNTITNIYDYTDSSKLDNIEFGMFHGATYPSNRSPSRMIEGGSKNTTSRTNKYKQKQLQLLRKMFR